VDVVGTTKAYAGATVTVTGTVDEMIVTSALPDTAGSNAAMAVSRSGLAAGIEEGARKSTLPATGPLGATQGLDPATQIWPSMELPLGIPFTVQLTAWLDASRMLAENESRWPVRMLADGGEMTTRF
jgi:hypothetical protein